MIGKLIRQNTRSAAVKLITNLVVGLEKSFELETRHRTVTKFKLVPRIIMISEAKTAKFAAGRGIDSLQFPTRTEFIFIGSGRGCF